MRRNPAVFAILVGGLIAGAFDITYAIVFSGFHGVPAMRILQSVASGLLGAAAYEGGASTAALGFVAHFLMAFLIAAIYYCASRYFNILVRRPVLCGALYGLGVYLVMNLIVIPLSAFPTKLTFPPPAVLLTANLVVHMFLFGVPIALATRKALTSSDGVKA